MLIIDTHTHLADSAFDSDRSAVIARAKDAGVGLLMAVGYDLVTSEKSLELAQADEAIWATVGIHPNSAAEWQVHFPRIEELSADPRIVAIGEIGLDYYRDRVDPRIQRASLDAHLDLADRRNLPVVIHDREAHDDLLAVLLPWAKARRAKGLGEPGVLHCFSGDLEMAEAAIEAGFLLSFGGSLTYEPKRRKSESLNSTTEIVTQEVALKTPARSIILETDCPWLAPTPHRGKRNEPAYLVSVLEKLAALRDSSAEEMARVTTENVKCVFCFAEGRRPIGIPAESRLER